MKMCRCANAITGFSYSHIIFASNKIEIYVFTGSVQKADRTIVG